MQSRVTSSEIRMAGPLEPEARDPDAKEADRNDTDLQDVLVEKALQRASWIVLPIIMAANMMMLIDRGNLAFAAVQMNADLGLDAQSYGLATGVFYLTYGLCQVPSAAVGLRVGMRRWFGAIIVAWGAIAMCTAFVQSAGQLYAVRLLLGAAEAGAAPCAFHIASSYFPYERVSKPISFLFFASQLASVISAPVATGLMSMNGVGGLAGWRWLMIIEGLPSILIGLLVWALLPGHPLQASWLPQEQQEALHTAVHGAAGAEAARRRPTLRDTLVMAKGAVRHPILWVLVTAGMLWVMAAWSLSAWIPVMVSNLLNGTALAAATSVGGGRSTGPRATLLSTVPYAVAALSLVAVAWHSDRCKEKVLHTAAPWMAGGVILACFGAVARRSLPGGFVMLCAAMGLAYGGQSTLCAVAAGITPPAQAAITLGIMNAIIAALGGFIGPFVVGAIVRSLGSFEGATAAMGAFLLGASAIMLGVWAWQRRWVGAGGGGAGWAAAAPGRPGADRDASGSSDLEGGSEADLDKGSEAGRGQLPPAGLQGATMSMTAGAAAALRQQ